MATVQDLIENAARARGVDPTALLAIAQIESAMNPNARNPNSGASGLFQFMPATAQQYDLADPTDPAAAADAGARLLADNARQLAHVLGRSPTTGELYLAHQQGASGARALLSNPDENAVVALTPAYGGDAARARQAVLMNGGNPNMTAGQFAQMWTSQGDQAAARIPPGSIPEVGSELSTGPLGSAIRNVGAGVTSSNLPQDASFGVRRAPGSPKTPIPTFNDPISGPFSVNDGGRFSLFDPNADNLRIPAGFSDPIGNGPVASDLPFIRQAPSPSPSLPLPPGAGSVGAGASPDVPLPRPRPVPLGAISATGSVGGGADAGGSADLALVRAIQSAPTPKNTSGSPDDRGAIPLGNTMQSGYVPPTPTTSLFGNDIGAGPSATSLFPPSVQKATTVNVQPDGFSRPVQSAASIAMPVGARPASVDGYSNASGSPDDRDSGTYVAPQQPQATTRTITQTIDNPAFSAWETKYGAVNPVAVSKLQDIHDQNDDAIMAASASRPPAPPRTITVTRQIPVPGPINMPPVIPKPVVVVPRLTPQQAADVAFGTGGRGTASGSQGTASAQGWSGF